MHLNTHIFNKDISATSGPHHHHHHHHCYQSRIECRPHQWDGTVVGSVTLALDQCLVLMAAAVPHGGTGIGACARGGATSSLASKAAVVSALHHSSGQCSASRRRKVGRQLGGDQPNGARLERMLLRRFLWLLVVVLQLLELRVSLGCRCHVWHRMIAWMMPRFGFSSSLIWWHVLRAMVVMSRKLLLLRCLPLRCPCLKLAGLKLAGLGTLPTPLDLQISVSSQAVASVTCLQLQVCPTVCLVPLRVVMVSARLRLVLLSLTPLVLHQREPKHCLPVCSLLVSVLFLLLCHTLSELHPDAGARV